MPRGFSTILAILCLVVACDAAEAPSVAARDSGGIAIVEYAAEPDAPAWSLSPEPDVVLGGLETGPNNELYEASHALRRDDGVLVVANQGTQELRFFGPGGSHLRTVGGEGGGPGEFEGMWGLVRLPGDSLGAWDRTSKRLTVYDSAGGLGRMVTVEAGGFFPRLIGRLDEHHVAVIEGLDALAVFGTRTGVRDDSVAVLKVEIRDGAIVDTLGPYPGDQEYTKVGETMFWIKRVVFGRKQLIDVAAGRVHVGNDRNAELRSYDAGGRLAGILRLGGESEPVTAAADQLYRERQLEDASEDRVAEERRRLAETPTAERFPAFDDLFADHVGRVWLRDFDPELGESRRWLIFDEAGKAVGRLDVPERFEPLDAGRDYVLFRTRDELDVERLLLFTLVR